MARSAPHFAAPRVSGGTFQRPNANFATNRFTGSPRAFTNVNGTNFRGTNFNRTGFNHSRVNLSRSGNFNRFGTNFNNLNGRRGDFGSRNGNWGRRHGDRDRFVFFDPFFFDPFWFPGYFPFWYGYPSYSYYPYPYGYDASGYDPYGYGSGYPTSGQIYYPSGTDYNDDTDYAEPGAQQETPAYDRTTRSSRSIIAQVQEQLARDGYYKGRIDGVQGSRTYYAIRAYERDHSLRVDGAVSDQLLSEMGLR